MLAGINNAKKQINVRADAHHTLWNKNAVSTLLSPYILHGKLRW